MKDLLWIYTIEINKSQRKTFWKWNNINNRTLKTNSGWIVSPRYHFTSKFLLLLDRESKRWNRDRKLGTPFSELHSRSSILGIPFSEFHSRNSILGTESSHCNRPKNIKNEHENLKKWAQKRRKDNNTEEQISSILERNWFVNIIVF